MTIRYRNDNWFQLIVSVLLNNSVSHCLCWIFNDVKKCGFYVIWISSAESTSVIVHKGNNRAQESERLCKTYRAWLWKIKSIEFFCVHLILYNSSPSHHRQMNYSSGIKKENINKNSGIKHERDGKLERLCMCKFSPIPFHTRFHHCRFHDDYVLNCYQFFWYAWNSVLWICFSDWKFCPFNP